MSGALQAVFQNQRSFGNPVSSVEYLVVGGGGASSGNYSGGGRTEVDSYRAASKTPPSLSRWIGASALL